MKQIDSFEFEVLEQPHVWVQMSDGCRLSARIWMPSNSAQQPVPAIVEHLPYRKRDGTVARDELTHPWFAGNGYACIRVDMRGNGESEGLMEDEYTAQELNDACEVIAWAAEQPWCSGSVGMMGISWGGFNSLQVAAMRPPALKAIITLCSTVDRFADDIHYKGGCLLNENFGWAANMLSYSSRPPDPALLGDQWRTLWLDRLEHMPFLASQWLRHQHRDDYWKHGSVCENYAAIEAAVLSIGGWHDGYRNTISHLVTHLQSPVKGIVGPWIHKYPHFAAPAPAIGFLQEAKRWWGRWLKDEATDVEADPAYRVWIMDSITPERWLPDRPGRWVGENQWPSNRISIEPWQLISTEGKGGLLASADVYPLELTVSSAQSCGEASGEYFPFAFGPELPAEQTPDDALSLVFDSEPLIAPMDIVGAPAFSVELEADSEQALLCARLCEIRADGSSALITLGLLNLSHHHSFEIPQRLSPGERFSAKIILDQIAFRVPAGHRLRLSLSTSYWPLVWPSPTPTIVSIHSGAMEIPVRQASISENNPRVTFEEPEAAMGWQADILRPSSSSRETTTDPTSGVVITSIFNDFGESRDRDHGLTTGSLTREIWSIHPDNPLSASAHITWQQTGGRDDWAWGSDVELKMHADQNNFYVAGKLVAYENGVTVFEREYKDVIERQFV